jgi:Fe-S cluster assembly protein SufB
VEAQFDSEAAYSNVKEELTKQGVIFVNSTEGLKNHEEIFRKWFGKVIPTGDNKFSALNSAVFSGGIVHLRAEGREAEATAASLLPHQLGKLRPVRAHAHHRRRRRRGDVHGRLHRAEVRNRHAALSAVVELVALKGAKIQYVTVQNWSEQRLQPRHQARARHGGRGESAGSIATSARA